MAWQRIVHRWGLTGDYRDAPADWRDDSAEARVQRLKANIAGDMRRLEQDTRDPRHLAGYAEIAGITPDQVRKVFDAFFDDAPMPHLDYERFPPPSWQDP